MEHYRYRQPPAKRRHTPIVPLSIVGLVVTYIATMLLWPLPPIQATVVKTVSPDAPITAAPNIQWPTYGQSAFGTKQYGVLESAGPANQSVPMASITKVVTALVVLEKKPIAIGSQGDSLRLTDQDTALFNKYLSMNGTVAPAPAGLTISQYQVLQTMMLSSANNYSDSLAIWAYGSLDAYVAVANKYLARHGLTATHVADASGFSPDSRSSANDLVRLGTMALDEPVLASIVAQKNTTIPNVGNLRNTNANLGMSGFVGIKTGTTDEAGRCLLFAATYALNGKTTTIIGVTMGAPDHNSLFRDTAALKRSIEAGFVNRQLSQSGREVASYRADWGETVIAAPTHSVSTTVWSPQPTKQQIMAPALQPGDPYKGNIVFRNGLATTNVALALEQPVKGPSWYWRLMHPWQILR